MDEVDYQTQITALLKYGKYPKLGLKPQLNEICQNAKTKSLKALLCKAYSV